MGKGYAVHFVRDETGCYRAWEIACELGPHRREMKTVTRDALPELLRKEGHEIVTAGNGQEPIERLTEVADRCLILLLNLRGSGHHAQRHPARGFPLYTA
jgi:CheY-like chemotaxis protein